MPSGGAYGQPHRHAAQRPVTGRRLAKVKCWSSSTLYPRCFSCVSLLSIAVMMIMMTPLMMMEVAAVEEEAAAAVETTTVTKTKVGYNTKMAVIIMMIVTAI